MVKKLISLPQEQVDYIEKRMIKSGVTFSEYVRRLIAFEMELRLSRRPNYNVK